MKKQAKKRVLVIGGGGREHALAWKLSQSPRVGEVFVAPGNGGTAQVAENVDIGFIDVEALLSFAKKNKIDLTVIGQEAASDAGLADAFEAAGLTIFGPTKAATRVESSKAFSKDLMRRQTIPTARYEVFADAKKALSYLEGASYPLVIKADGLAEGKGVVICRDAAQAHSAIESMMRDKTLKDAGSRVVIEEFLVGQEISIHALADGKNITLFPPSQDYKQIFDGDEGPNTGGIGVIAPVSWVTEEQMAEIEKKVVQPALAGLRQAATPFQGCLYPGLMMHGGEMNVIEFNARFGDPEAEVYMRLLESDLFELLDSCAHGRMDAAALKWKPGFALSVSLCSGGYPGSYGKGLPITGLGEAEKMESIVLFHSGTKKNSDGYKTNGGRVLHVTATGQSIAEARAKVYAAIKKINFEGMHYRTDIGLRDST
jgi:phosphoribosylamine--glycine ligase